MASTQYVVATSHFGVRSQPRAMKIVRPSGLAFFMTGMEFALATRQL